MTTGRGTAANPIDGRAFVSPIGTRRVEMSLALAMSIFGVLFTVQTVPVMLQQWRSIATPLGLALVVLVYGAVAVAGLAALLRQWTKPIFLGAAVVYLAAMAIWPASVDGPLGSTEPWLFGLSTVACGFVTVALRGWVVPALYAFVTTGLIGLLRAVPAGGGVTDARAVLDAVYALVLALALLILATGLRQAASAVDTAQTAALQSYARAQIDEATESQRVQTDALVHDSVLTTFISAGRAESPEARALAGRMAGNAMRILSQARLSATRDRAGAVPIDRVATLVRQEAGDVSAAFVFEQAGAADVTVPEAAAEALIGGAVQAMVNSVNHAGGPAVHRRVLVTAVDGGVRVLVEDRGAGFDVATMSTVRLGVRVSILERVRLAGGSAELDSAPGAGTRVTLTWPAGARDVAEPGPVSEDVAEAVHA